LDKQTAILVLIGLALRIILIFPGPLESRVAFLSNKADLRNYYWPAQAALRGENPYVLWANGQSGEFRADMAPLELLLFRAVVRVWDDPRAIQVLFAVFDAVNIALLGTLFASSRLKLPFQLFYALGPLTLYNLVLVPEDKTIVISLTLLLFLLLARLTPLSSTSEISPITPHASRITPHVSRFTFYVSRITYHASRLTPHSSRITLAVVVVAALLASFKWLSVFYLFPLLFFVSPGVRQLVKNGLIFALVVALAHVPWFPTWSYMYTFRLGRVATPIHIAPGVLLNAVGLYHRELLLTVLVLSLLMVYVLLWFKRIDIFETITISAAVGVLWTPDMDPVHLSLVVLMFLLVLDWSSRWRQSVIWILSAWVAFVYAVSTHTGFTRYGLPDLQIITGSYGSLQMVFLSYPLFFAVLGLYVYDKFSGRRLKRQEWKAQLQGS
jgi:hypothetical protein